MHENATRMRDAVTHLLSGGDHPVREVYRTLCRLATGHHAILLEEPSFGPALALAERGAAEILGIPLTKLWTHQDVTYLPSDGRHLPIETARQMIDHISLGSAEGRRVILFEDMERLGTPGMNALLKTLEDPDNNLLFLLTTSHPDALLPTIRSRVLTVHIGDVVSGTVARAMLDGYTLEEQEWYLLLCSGRPALLEIVLAEREEKNQPLTTLLSRCHEISTALLQGTAKDRLITYKALLALKEEDATWKKRGENGERHLRPLDLFCLHMEGRLENALKSTTIDTYPEHIGSLAQGLLQFRTDVQNAMNIKLACLDFVFGADPSR